MLILYMKVPFEKYTYNISGNLGKKRQRRLLSRRRSRRP